MERWKTEKSETLLDTSWVKVRRDSVRLPNGATIDDNAYRLNSAHHKM